MTARTRARPVAARCHRAERTVSRDSPSVVRRQVAQPRPYGSGTHAPAVARCFSHSALSRARRRGILCIRNLVHTKTRRCRARRRRRALLLRPGLAATKVSGAASPHAVHLRVFVWNNRPSATIRQIPARSGDPVAPGWYPVADAHGPRSIRRARTETCSTAGRLVPRACPAEPVPAAASRSGFAACAAPGPGTLGS